MPAGVMSGRVPAGNPGGAGWLQSHCLTHAQYNRALNFPSAKSKGSWLTASLELSCHCGWVTLVNLHTNLHQEQCAGNSVSYMSRVLAPSNAFSSLCIQSSNCDKIFHLCEIFHLCVLFQILTELRNTSLFIPCFEASWFIFFLDSKWLRWSTRCLANFQNEWSLPQENHIKLKTVREWDWLIIRVDVVRTNFLSKEIKTKITLIDLHICIPQRDPVPDCSDMRWTLCLVPSWTDLINPELYVKMEAMAFFPMNYITLKVWNGKVVTWLILPFSFPFIVL